MNCLFKVTPAAKLDISFHSNRVHRVDVVGPAVDSESQFWNFALNQNYSHS